MARPTGRSAIPSTSGSYPGSRGRWGRFFVHPASWSLLTSPSPQGEGKLDVLVAAAGIAEIGIGKQLVEFHHAADQALLVAIAQHRFEIFAVRVAKAVGPGVGTENLKLFFPGGSDPGQWHHSRVGDAAVGHRLGRVECFGEIG